MRSSRSLLLWLAISGACLTANADSIWDLQAVNAIGMATHPEVGADPSNPANKVVVEGIALNYSQDYLDPNSMFQLYVQAEAPDKGGIAAWAGAFYQGGPGSEDWLDEFARLTSSGFKPGDRVRIEGYVAFMRGKTNINERHSAAPSLDFTITVLQANVGMPDPTVLPAIGTWNFFDETRTSGAEVYQATWCQLQNVWIADWTGIAPPGWGDGWGWGANKTLLVTDGTGTFPVYLSSRGDFDSYAAPTGIFSVTGIFDQEDMSSPFTGSYRLWVKNYGDFGPPIVEGPVPEPAGCALFTLGAAGLLRRRGRRRE